MPGVICDRRVAATVMDPWEGGHPGLNRRILEMKLPGRRKGERPEEISSVVKEEVQLLGVTEEDAGDKSERNKMETDDPLWRPRKGKAQKRCLNHFESVRKVTFIIQSITDYKLAH